MRTPRVTAGSLHPYIPSPLPSALTAITVVSRGHDSRSCTSPVAVPGSP